MISRIDQYLVDRYWHPVAHRSELESTNDYVRFDIGDEEVVAFNDGAGVVVFDNLCPHRGTRIFEGDTGTQRFVCPYHGWSFARGKLFRGAARALDGDAPVPGLSTWQHCWVGNLLFASKSPLQSIEEQLGATHERLISLSQAWSRRHDWNGYTFACDWKVAVENAQEPYHIGQIHPDTLSRLKLTSGRNEFAGDNSFWFAEVDDPSMKRGLDRIGKLFQLEFQHKGYMSLYLFPFSMISSTYGYSYSMQSFFPIGVANCANFASRLYTSRLAPGIKPAILEAFFDDTVRINRQVFEEDHAICRRLPVRAWKNGTDSLVTGEEKVAAFRRSIANAEADLPQI